MQKATNGGTRSDPRSRWRTTKPGCVAVGGALGRERRQAERLRRPAATSQNCTTAYCGSWVNSPFQNCGLLPPISHVWRIRYLVTSSNLAKRLSLGVYLDRRRRHLGDERGVDRGLHVGGLGRRRRVVPSCSMPWTVGRSSTSSSVGDDLDAPPTAGSGP